MEIGNNLKIKGFNHIFLKYLSCISKKYDSYNFYQCIWKMILANENLLDLLLFIFYQYPKNSI